MSIFGNKREPVNLFLKKRVLLTKIFIFAEIPKGVCCGECSIMGKNSLFIVVLLLLSIVVSGQKIMRNTSILNYQRGDHGLLHFGFTLGMNYMDYRALMSDDASYRAESGKLSIGFVVGMVSELRICESLGLRFLPGLEFSSRSLAYPNTDEGKIYSYSESVYASVPLMLKYKAKRLNNYRPFVTAGGSMKYDFQRHDKINPEKSIYFRTKPTEFFVETGVGCDFYLPYFKFGIELRFSLGVSDVMVHKYDTEIPGYEKFTDAIKKLNSRMFSVCFNFE